MESITTATIVISVGSGSILGFIAICMGNLGVKLMVDTAGAATLLFFIWTIMPTITWGTPTIEGAENAINFAIFIVLALVSYVAGDAFGSLGYTAVMGVSRVRV